MKPLVQRQEMEEEELAAFMGQRAQKREAHQEEREEDINAFLQRQEEEEELQMKPLADGGFEASSDLEQRLTTQRSNGRPLSPDVRSFMEPRFGADFSNVRIHTDGDAVQMTRELNAKAFTHSQDIYFGAGKYDPGSSGGQRLLAHELTHTIQQGGRKDRIARWGGPGDTTSHVEVTNDAFQKLRAENPNAEMWYSNDAQNYLAKMSEQMDQRAGFLVGSFVPGKIYQLGQWGGRRTAKTTRWTGRKVAKGTRATWRGLRRGLGRIGEEAGGMSRGMEQLVLDQTDEGGNQTRNRSFWGKLGGKLKSGAKAIGKGTLASLMLPYYSLAKGTEWLGGKTGITSEQKTESEDRQEERERGATVSEKKKLATEYDELKTYWRSSSEAPNHGEGGMYKSQNGAGRDAARVNEYVEKAVGAYDSKNPRQALSILALGLHAAEDRGAHGDGMPGTGHDPRRASPPPNEYAESTYYQQSLNIHNQPWQPKWCDNKSKNPNGYTISVEYGKQVLENFAKGIGVVGGEEEEQPSQRELLKRGGRLAGFTKPGKFKRFWRKTGMFFGKDAIR